MADKPVTREEKYLAYLTGDYTGELPKPITRKEKYLYELCLKGIGGEISPEEIKNAVTNWLNEHPEATTTVQDGSVTEQKIFSSFLPYIKKDYITPQMFGAKGDGVTDDTKTIQEAIVFCENNKRLLYIPSGVYMVSDTLTISKSIAILGSSVHKDVLSSYNEYMGISVLKFIAKSDKTLIATNEKAYDVSINSLVFLATSYEVHVSGNISVEGDCKKVL